MFIPLLIMLGVVLGAWLFLFRMRRRRLYELADKLPGLPQLPFIGHLHRFVGDAEDLQMTIQEISYSSIDQGGISKAWVGHILYCLLTDPVDIEYVLKMYIEKDETTRFIRKILGNGVIFAPASLWRRRRRIMAPGFSKKTLELFFEVFSEKSDALVEQLSSHVSAAAGAGEFNLWPLINTYSLDAVLETIFGMDTTDRSTDYKQILSEITRILHLTSERFFRPWLHPDWLYRISSSYKAFHESTTFVYSFIDKIIKRTQMDLMGEQKAEEDEVKESAKRASFLRLLINQSSKSQPYSDLELREEVMSLTAAGTDTSAVGTCFTLLLLARHQDAQDRVYQELLEVFGKSERPLVKEDLSKLCYLEQVIKESLRLYPPVPLISRQADKEITLPCGAVLPAGCGIIISIWGVHRNPAYWGADVEQFRPERFSPERYNPQHACVYMPFSTGPRNCLGYQYAMMSLKTSLATVLRRYKVRVAGDASVPIRVKFEIMLKAVEGFNVLLEQRVK